MQYRSEQKAMADSRPDPLGSHVEDLLPGRRGGGASPLHHLLWTASGMLAVETEQRTWLVPTTLAIWLPAGTLYTVTSSPRQAHRVAVAPEQASVDWASPTVVGATGFVRESIVRLADPGLSLSERRRTEVVLCDALRPFPHSGLDLPVPLDSRVRLITEALLVDPADRRTIADWGREVGASVRNLTRLFSAETGMTFVQWRLHARTRQAILALASDATVGEVALSVGYSSTSAFVHAFRRTTGITPATFASTMRLNGQFRPSDASRKVERKRMRSDGGHDDPRCT